MRKENIQKYEHPYGGSVRKKFPFGDLVAHSNGQKLTTEFARKWAAPFYMEVFKSTNGEDFIVKVGALKDQITKKVVLDLLGVRNWRTRITGAYFAVVKEYTDVQDIIGVHLLRSDMCCAGAGYCIALAAFNTTKSRDYLTQYLDYYLQEPELWFDQNTAMAVLKYLDKINGTYEVEKYLSHWRKFIENKEYWKEELETDGIEKAIEDIQQIKKYGR